MRSDREGSKPKRWDRSRIQRFREYSMRQEAHDHPAPVRVLVKDGQPVAEDRQWDLFSPPVAPPPEEFAIAPKRDPADDGRPPWD